MLSIAENAYIRPSPSRCHLGGVARGTHGAIHILEAAGYDRVIVETVGVGQSEVQVDSMVDLFLLLLPPAGGDELQGIKKGVVELADILAITKSDGELLNVAKQARGQYANALMLLRPKTTFWYPETVNCSAVAPNGLDKVLVALSAFEKAALVSSPTDAGEL
jgi:LAO/AO transport system kinase